MGDVDKNFVMWNASQRAIREVGNKTPYINKGALWGVDFCALAGKGRTDYWESVLGIGTDTTKLRADLMPLLTKWHDGKVASAERDFDGIAKLVQRDGFDNAEKSYRTSARTLKYEWKRNAATVGEAKEWGSAVGRDWFPAGWGQDLEMQPAAGIKRKIDAHKDEIRTLESTAIRVEVNKEEIDKIKAELEESKAAAAEAEAAVGKQQEHLASLQAPYESAKENRAALCEQEKKFRKLLDQENCEDVLLCPHCNKEVVIVDSPTGAQLAKPTTSPNHTANIKKLEADLAEACKQVEAANQACEKLTNECLAEGRNLKELEAQESSLAALMEKQEAWIKHKSAQLAKQTGKARTEADQNRIDELTDEIEKLEKSLTIKYAKDEADRLHQSIMLTENIAYRLSSKGFRAEQMIRGVESLNKVVIKICKAHDWPLLKIGKDLSLSWGGRPVQLASKSAQWRVCAILSCAVAWVSGAKLIIFDGADILDEKNYGGFLDFIKEKLVDKLEMSVLWCATIQSGHKELLESHGFEINTID